MIIGFEHVYILVVLKQVEDGVTSKNCPSVIVTNIIVILELDCNDIRR